jgi:two-component system C4-dicarboxylate transport sensor histidine kinase DctB
VLRRAFENVRPTAGALVPKQVGLTGATAHFDETLLERVLQSLLHNAVAAVEGHPTPEVTVEVGRTPKDVQLIVRDNGPGVTSDAEPRLFEPFFTTRAHGQGTGLGLAVAKGLMHAQGGDLRFLGNSPSGAQFILTLPASMREGET